MATPTAPKNSLLTRCYKGVCSFLFGTPEQQAYRKERGNRAAAKIAATNEGGGTFVSTGKVGPNQGVPISATGSMRKRSRRTLKNKTRKHRT